MAGLAFTWVFGVILEFIGRVILSELLVLFVLIIISRFTSEIVTLFITVVVTSETLVVYDLGYKLIGGIFIIFLVIVDWFWDSFLFVIISESF